MSTTAINATRQRTIAREVNARGRGLHTGCAVNVRLLPAPADSGLTFIRRDLKPAAAVKSCADAVGDTRLATCLQQDGAQVSTVEHFLSALAAAGVDNLRVELDAPEMPIFDGSAAPWLLLLKTAGARAQDAPKKFIRVLREVRAEEGEGKWAAFAPAQNAAPRYDIRVDFPHKVVRRTPQTLRAELRPARYGRDIARARTFCHLGDVEQMQKSGRAAGGSLDCAVVFDDFRVLNPEGLRYADEFVRHKILDVMGDCYINGHIIFADYAAERPGHGLNNKLVRKLLATENAWEYAEAESGGAWWEESPFASARTA